MLRKALALLLFLSGSPILAQQSFRTVQSSQDPTGPLGLLTNLNGGQEIDLINAPTTASQSFAFYQTGNNNVRQLVFSMSPTGASTSSIGLTGAAGTMNVGPTTPTVGSTQAVDWLWGTAAAQTLLLNEAGIWPSAKVFSGFGFSKDFNSSTNSSSSGLGPNATGFFFARNSGSNNDVLGLLGDTNCTVSNTVCFGGNVIARSGGGSLTGVKLNGFEIDVEPAVGDTMAAGSIGLPINIFSVASPGPAIQTGGVGGGTWANGIVLANIASTGNGVATFGNMRSSLDTSQGIYVNDAIILGTGAAQAISFGGAGFGTSPLLYGDSSGNTILNMGTGGAFFLKNPAGTTQITFDQFGGVTGGKLLVSVAGGGVGYTTGAGGAVTQLTSRTTGVTLNNITGAITLFSAAGSATATTFTVTDSAVAATDTVILNQKSGTNLYEIFITAVAAGSFNVTFFTTGGTATDAPVFNFNVIKGSAN